MDVTPTRMGWVRFRHGRTEGAARLDSDGTLIELVLADPPKDSQGIAEGLAAWWTADAAGRVDVERGAWMRIGATTEAQLAVDAEERSEPARRAAWGRSPDAEAGQAAMIAMLSLSDIAQRPRPDGFYVHVAEVYAAAGQMGRGPADIAAASGARVALVYQWLKEARRRGLLAPARRGAA